ncbi:hypothetical protein [Kitasatospora sp. NPDC097643]|uniref:hypothetical protein n=1 Tax=Kitasatospora sp. NPDC097643 TaxID=3157230 RepID=UPI00333256C5
MWLTLSGREFPFPEWTDAVVSVLGSMGEGRVRAAVVDDGWAGAVDGGGMREGEVVAGVVVPLCVVAGRQGAVKELIRVWARAHGGAEVAGVLSRMCRYDVLDPRLPRGFG